VKSVSEIFMIFLLLHLLVTVMPLICCFCKLPFTSLKAYFAHLRLNHAIHHTGVEVKCNQEGCPRSFVIFRRLKRHIESKHAHILKSDDVEHSSCSLQRPAMGTSAVDRNALVEQEAESAVVSTSVDLTNSFMYFVGQLQSKANISQSNIQVVVENMSMFLNDVAEYSAAKVRKLCNDLNTDVTSVEVQTCLNYIKQLPQHCMEKVDTHFKWRKLLRQTRALIEPQEIVCNTIIMLGCQSICFTVNFQLHVCRKTSYVAYFNIH
jgi:hypothetical protein